MANQKHEVDLSAFLPAVKLYRAWAEIGEMCEKIGPFKLRQPIEEYQRRIAEADRLLALIGDNDG